MDLLAEKRIKVTNGGAQNLKRLAEKTQELVSSLSNEVEIGLLELHDIVARWIAPAEP